MSLSGSELDILRGLVLIGLVFGFLGICVWAWGNKRKRRFHEASLLPLQDDEVDLSASREVKNSGSNRC